MGWNCTFSVFRNDKLIVRYGQYKCTAITFAQRYKPGLRFKLMRQISQGYNFNWKIVLYDYKTSIKSLTTSSSSSEQSVLMSTTPFLYCKNLSSDIYETKSESSSVFIEDEYATRHDYINFDYAIIDNDNDNILKNGQDLLILIQNEFVYDVTTDISKHFDFDDVDENGIEYTKELKMIEASL
ncbi:hypothetical protein Hesp032 [Hemileuca sp. nucleopolyhedrovirus]|uniref:Uncharacterized protein n=1 Tax=Hemileuca sp. nucleopolyhedrovirus TaxID=1367203 RepID=S5MQA1_9ABAC|nr:hypothetical protein Hesp032 [Hemileuca sp. nucleopolyhedrovirus]AGR56784.1 hypothetical protein Hesp032 [Hemileuca sp. nucleopolyhedrovirus]